MLYIDIKYVGLLSSQLKNFKRRSEYLWNFSCPICGDSKVKKTKARGYIYRIEGKLCYKCHNCGRNITLGTLLKEINPSLHDQYTFEKYKNAKHEYLQQESKLLVEQVDKEITSLGEDDRLSELERIDNLPLEHPAVKYVLNRKIPKDKWQYLYLCHKIKIWTNQHIKPYFHDLENDHPRLVIPYFNAHGKVFGVQSRAFGNETPRYYSLKVDQKAEMIFGLDRVDWSKPILVVEGPIDSLFLDNCVAVSGSSNFDSDSLQKIKTNCVLVLDREPRNKDVGRSIEKYINEGYSICLFPDNCNFKDINDAILQGYTKESLTELITQNTCSGLEARIKFSSWKKF